MCKLEHLRNEIEKRVPADLIPCPYAELKKFATRKQRKSYMVLAAKLMMWASQGDVTCNSLPRGWALPIVSDVHDGFAELKRSECDSGDENAWEDYVIDVKDDVARNK